MLFRLKNIREAFENAGITAPVEICVSLICYCIAVVDFYGDGNVGEWLTSFPVFFSLIYAVNKWTRDTRLRFLYYFSGLSVLGFWWWDLQLDSTLYWISFLVSQLCIALTAKRKDNESFVQNGLCYLQDMAAAIFLALLSWLLGWAVLASVRYIFDFSFSSKNSIIYPQQVAWLLIAPVVFLMFNTRKKREFMANRFLDTLMNFIVSPALVIYNVILYLYFIKITFLWSLPKGGIAYIVLTFFCLLLFGKGVQPVLRHRYFDWYYRYFSVWVLLPLVMLWTSICYRVNEYGWTEWRVYLVLIALVASIATGLFFVSSRRQYRWITGLLLGGVFFLSYIPGITAKDFGVRSQGYRIEQMVGQLYSPEDRMWKTATDSVTIARYKILQNSANYIKRTKNEQYLQKRFGVEFSDLIKHLPDRNGCDSNFYLNYPVEKGVNISGFETLQIIRGFNHNSIRSTYRNGHLVLTRQEDTLADIDLNRQFREKLVEAGIDTTTVLSQESLLKSGICFWEYEAGDQAVLLQSININGCEATVSHAIPGILLTRKK